MKVMDDGRLYHPLLVSLYTKAQLERFIKELQALVAMAP